MIEPILPFSAGGIPVPGWEGMTSQSVEGIWRGLKVIESGDIDTSSFENVKMRGMKRTVRKHGRVLGHRYGGPDGKLLGYVEPRKRIDVPYPEFHGTTSPWDALFDIPPDYHRIRPLLMLARPILSSTSAR